MRRQSGEGGFMYRVLGAAVGVALWEFVGRSEMVPLLPPFSSVVLAWIKLMREGTIFDSFAISLQSLAVGSGLALLVGLPLGMLIGRYQRFEQTIGPYVNIAMSMPLVAVVPILLIWFGLGATSRIAVVFLFSFYVVIINTAAGIRQTESSLMEAARSFGAKERDLFFKIMMPSAVPLMFAGIRMGINRGIKGMVLGEMLVMAVGIGAKLMRYGAAFNMDLLFAMLFSVIIFAVLVSAALEYSYNVFIPWKKVKI